MVLSMALFVKILKSSSLRPLYVYLCSDVMKEASFDQIALSHLCCLYTEENETKRVT